MSNFTKDQADDDIVLSLRQAIAYLGNQPDADHIQMRASPDQRIILYTSTKYWPRLEYWPVNIPCKRSELRAVIDKCLWLRELINTKEVPR